MKISDSEASIDPSDDLVEGFEPSTLPPPAPDGGPILEPAPLHLPIALDSLCDRGPCRHRHRFEVVTEAADPLDGSSLERPKIGPDGNPIVKYREPDVLAHDGTMRPGREIYETEPYTPVTVTRVCYPSPGVKIELGEAEPIHRCSRWDPEDPADPDIQARDDRRARFFARETSADVEDLNGDGGGGASRIRGKR